MIILARWILGVVRLFLIWIQGNSRLRSRDNFSITTIFGISIQRRENGRV